MTDKKIVLLGVHDEATRIIYNAVAKKFTIAQVFLEQKESKKVFLKRRAKKLGWLKVIGQILFIASIQKILQTTSKQRVQEILQNYQLNSAAIPNVLVTNINSINEPTSIDLIVSMKPDLVLINGTRILSKKLLAALPCACINMHAGITPKYRGVHGGYWALANNDKANMGVTVHFVDAGIDTGNVIAQQQVVATSKDNFATYPYLQLAEGAKVLTQAIDNYFKQQIKLGTGTTESNLWYHPTLWQYLYNRVIKKVK
jgi:methionyl-tRNA formyltransferase